LTTSESDTKIFGMFNGGIGRGKKYERSRRSRRIKTVNQVRFERIILGGMRKEGGSEV